MNSIGNLLWLILGGILVAIIYFIVGLLMCITIIGIPFGKQCFKMARLSVWPMGTDVKTDFGKHPIANVIWLIFGGLGLGIGFFFAGILWCVTIIGIPFGKQCFKLAKLGLTPFGATVS